MNTRRWSEIDAIFQAAVALPSQERCAYLDDSCGLDPELRAEVESLLAMDDGSEAFAASRLEGVEVLAAGLLAHERVGEYRLVRLLGSGGMGAVYLAERDDGEFQQRVAIKFANVVNASDWIMERFLAERNILARLEHPNIARLLGGGQSKSGVRYLVMEFVDGQHIGKWCRDRNPGIADRVRLFLGVCDAVAYAHRSLVIHHDIKPGNILVTQDGQPKLLDFGISKILDPQDNGLAAQTIRIMTPAYASPEQVTGNFVSTATDIYSLGAVLYELLTDQPPFELDTSSPARIERLICDSDPPLPSKLANRKALAGDLDTIVLKAMHKAPDRRYSSVEALASDLRLYLPGRPVKARPDTLAYRTGKFIRRHKIPVVAAVFCIALTAVAIEKTIEKAQRAQRTFRQLRNMANAYLLEMPGKTAGKSVPEIQLEMARMYERFADPLVAAQAGDPEVSREIARGYEKLGNVLGLGDAAAIGLIDEAHVYFSKAIALLQPLLDSGSLDTRGKAILGRSYCGSGRLQDRKVRPGAGGADYAKCLALLASIVGDRYVREFLLAHAWAGDAALAMNNLDGAGWHYAEIVRVAKQERSKDEQARTWQSNGLLRIGRLQWRKGDAERARQTWQEALLVAIPNPQAADLDSRLLQVTIRMELERFDPSLRQTTQTLLSGIVADFPSHPLVLDLAGEERVH